MPKKNQWPVAKTERHRVAVWFDLFSWPVVRDGIVRKYLDLRADEGALAARNEIRQAFPLTWKHNQRLEFWRVLDTTGTLFRTRPQEALKLYEAGWSACLGGYDLGGGILTPEKLVALGDKHQSQGYEKETAEIERQAPNCDAPYFEARRNKGAREAA
jgi:hypothetical protein